MSTKAYEAITAKIVDMLKAGTVPWRKPWVAHDPQNCRGNKYRGFNRMITACQPFRDPRWVTFNQAKSMGGSVRKGEKGTPIVFFKWIRTEKEKANGEKVRGAAPMMRYYTVFNVEQCDGLDILPIAEPQAGDIEPDEHAEATIAAWLEAPPILHDSQQAYYSPARDEVHMPPREQFASVEGYYSTLFHELTHSTGHDSRLARKFGGSFGSKPYAREELVAEMGAAFLLSDHRMEVQHEQNAAYVASWIKALQNDPRMVVIAAQQAQKAADMIMGRKAQHEAEEETAAAA